MNAQSEIFTRQESGFYISKINTFGLNIAKFIALQGNSFIPTPTRIKKKHCIINVKNVDNRCIVYAILGHFVEFKKGVNKNRPQPYEPFMHLLDMSDVIYPASLASIPVIESNNTHLDLCINVYSLTSENEIIIEYISDKNDTSENIVNLLLLRDSNNRNHYTFISSMGRLIGSKYKKNPFKIYSIYFWL